MCRLADASVRETGLIQLTERILNQTYNEIMVIIGAQGWRRKCSDGNLTVTPDDRLEATSCEFPDI